MATKKLCCHNADVRDRFLFCDKEFPLKYIDDSDDYLVDEDTNVIECQQLSKPLPPTNEDEKHVTAHRESDMKPS